MTDNPKDHEADKRRDELARRLLKTPPMPRKPKPTKPEKVKPAK